MEARVKRMVTEYIELGDKLHKLTAFLSKLDKPETYPPGMDKEDVDLLTEQHLHMLNYQAMLYRRLEKAGVDLGKEPELTFGMKLVGSDFNPSGDDKVKRLKALAAEMADIMDEHCQHTTTNVEYILRAEAFGSIKAAAMFSVATITNKH